MHTSIATDPFAYLDTERTWQPSGVWPCQWVYCAEAGNPPFVTAYRLKFPVEADATIRVHVSADERYELFLDGTRIGRGPERGEPQHWCFETYDLPVTRGKHCVVARVWSLGELAPHAQMSQQPGFLLAAEGAWLKRLSTGHAAWEAKLLPGYDHVPPAFVWGTGARVTIDAAKFAWGFERGAGRGWRPTPVAEPAVSASSSKRIVVKHLLWPAALPAMMEAPRQVGRIRHVAAQTGGPVRLSDHLSAEVPAWQDWVLGHGPVTIPPHTTRRVVVDLENYYCAYPQLITSGGAGSRVRISWAEALFETPTPNTDRKGQRDEIEGKYFIAIGNTFCPDGAARRRFETLWWESGRYVECAVQTAEEALTLEQWKLCETRYPLEPEARFSASDARLEAVMPIMTRAWQMCAHETFMDCPYYEQLMYVGDTRMEALTTYCLTHDDRLPRKALAMFDFSRRFNGLTQARFPARTMQIIPPFALWWVAMVHDFARWRDDATLVRARMPGVRAVIDHFLSLRSAVGLVQGPDGWNYMDWVRLDCWRHGIPPEGQFGVSSVINWQFVLVLRMVAELERYVGEPELAARATRVAGELTERIHAGFWDETRGLYADDPAHQHFSQHAQCLAVLAGVTGTDRIMAGLLTDKDLAPMSIYFSFYLLETYCRCGHMDAFFARLGEWFDLKEQGFKTTREAPEPSRSDCHGWGAHPIYHYFASVLGIRPGDFGFKTVVVAPQLGHLTRAAGRLPHPAGFIDVKFENGRGTISLPPGVTGRFLAAGRTVDLAGTQRVSF
jgi:hypothetical protein